MPATYPTPHLLGRVSYPENTTLQPDGDTVHIRNPVVLFNGTLIEPKNGSLEIWTTGAQKPKIIPLKGKPGDTFLPVRFEGLDAPEEHYQSTPFSLKMGKATRDFPLTSPADREERAQPRWKPAADYVLGTLQKAGWALVQLDREVTDRYGRALGYVYASNAEGKKKTFVSLELLKRGLAFPFLFESAGDLIPQFLKAAAKAKAKNLGVWRRYHRHPLPFTKTFSAPAHHTDDEPVTQLDSPLNLPGVFRRVVDAHQLKGLSLKLALQKYDAMDYETGTVVPGDQYHKIPIERLIWAPHRFK